MRARSSRPPPGGTDEEAAHDPELQTIFREEMARHLGALVGAQDVAETGARALHAMKGAAAMMGYGGLAASLHEVDLAVRAGDGAVASQGLRALAGVLKAHGIDAPDIRAVAELATQQLTARPTQGVDEEYQDFFAEEARGRLQSVAARLVALDAAGARMAPRSELDAALRDVHAIKGAAGLVGATVVARGAHALEGAFAELRTRSGPMARTELTALVEARDRLALALADPADGARAVDELVRGLRAAGLVRDHDITEPPRSMEARPQRGADVIRVPTQSVARLTEAMGEVGLVHARVARHAGAVHDTGRVLQRVGMAVEDALRRIGPARPWGAPADALRELAAVGVALAREGTSMEREAQGLQHDAELLGALSAGARDALKGIGAVTAEWLFDRVAPVVEAAAGAEKSARVERHGEATELDRGVAERLVEPLSQMVRNAVAHGIERPSSRLAAGKPARATVRLSAESDGDVLRIAVEDDGAGVDIAAVRARAARLGLLPAEGELSDATVFEVLFEPGVSTRERADPEAGRGVGLDLVRQEVRALGGTVRVQSTRGVGSRFEMKLTQRPVAQRVVRVRAGDACVALPLARVMRVVRVGDARMRRVSLAVLFGAPEVGERMVVLASARGEVGLVVESVEAPYEIVVRAMPEVLAGAGPWGAAAVDGEGRVTLVVDPDRLG